MTAGGTSPFVARAGGRWTLMPIPGNAASPVDLADLSALCREAEAAPEAPPAAPIVALDGTETVAPAPALVGQLTPSGWRIADLIGKPTTLALEDLAVLDRVEGAASVATLTAAGADPAALARLVAAGALLVTERHPAPLDAPELADARVEAAAVSTVPDVVEPPPRSRGVAAVLRRLLPARTAPPVEPAAADPAVADPGEIVSVEDGAVEDGPVEASPADGRIPVYAIWHEGIGPVLSLGMLTAAGRAHDGGALNQVYEIRRPETAESFLADLARREGPAVLLCSDYVWSLELNLAVAARAVALNPALVVVHGGPSSPKYEADIERFLDTHAPVAHVLARGEGERTLCELLTVLATAATGPGTLDGEALATVAGITYRDPRTGLTVRTVDRERIADLDDLPSPYLTGEFDHIPPSAWNVSVAIETNRGCPYGCTFCDWGSATLSRIRKFSLERVTREVEWVAARQIPSIQLTDANFGIMARDVETAAAIAAASERTHFPESLIFCPAKNTTKHLSKIIDILADAAIASVAALGVQTTDPTTLEAIDRTNIAVDGYVALAAEHRRRGHALQGELLLGLPEQTYASYRADLQFMFDHEIPVRTWSVQLLPNAPMSEPGYRARHRIETDDDNVVISTSSFTQADRDRMFRLRKVDMMFETYGLLRHVLRWLQWDHGILATDVADLVLDVTERSPHRFPHLTWIVSYFDLQPSPPLGWGAFYDDVRALLIEDLDVAPSTAMDCAFELNQFLMPAPGRHFPASIDLPHDYVAYHREATSGLYATGHPGRPDRPLADRGPARFTVTADPLRLCEDGLRFAGDSRDEVLQGDFYMATSTANELLSPLVRLLPHVIRCLDPAVVQAVLAERRPPVEEATPIEVDLHRRPVASGGR